MTLEELLAAIQTFIDSASEEELELLHCQLSDIVAEMTTYDETMSEPEN